MPSTATITAFYEFSANTKARASLVNANFDVFRGHLLPLNVATATAANNTWDLGSAEYSFRKGYMGELNLGATTTSWRIKDDTTTGGGDLVFLKNSVEALRIKTSNAFTSTASVGGIAKSSGVLSENNITTTSLPITGTTATIATGGSPVDIFVGPRVSSGNHEIIISITDTAPSLSFYLYFYRNTTTSQIGIYHYQESLIDNTTTVSFTREVRITPYFRFIDDSAPAGTNYYFMGASKAGGSMSITDLSLFAKEIW